MKIKEICEKTGLTDRTVRYYIEEGLVSPTYTENYIGRKSFDFADEDLERLRGIATLRTFSFTVEEIKALLCEGASSQEIVEAVKRRTEESLDDSRRCLSVLSGLDLSQDADILTLAKTLYDGDKALRNETVSPNPKKQALSFLKSTALFLIVWMPVFLSATILLIKFFTLHTPTVDPLFLVGTLLCMLPSVLTALIFKRGKKARKYLSAILMSLCVLSLPLSIGCSLQSVVLGAHVYGAWEILSLPSCIAPGALSRVCECGHRETSTIARIPCTYVDNVCLMCGQEMGETVDGHTHIYSARVVLLAPTCTDEGIGERTCACGDKKSEIIPKLEHVYSIHTVLALPSCKREGLVERICDCGAQKQEKLPMTAHEYSEWQVTYLGDCYSDGQESRWCATCRTQETRPIPGRGHTLGSWTVVKEATCQGTGVSMRKCFCGYSESETIKRIDHKYVGHVCSMCGKHDGTDFVPDYTTSGEINLAGTERSDARYTSQGKWVYFAYDGNRIVKFRKGGSEVVPICTLPDENGAVQAINVVGDWIYFAVEDADPTKGYVARMRTDGSLFEKLLTGVTVREMLVIGERIFFVTPYTSQTVWNRDHYPLYVMPTDGGMILHVHDGIVTDLIADSEYIYFCYEDETKADVESVSICRMRHDTSGTQVLCDGIRTNYIFLENGRIYFMDFDKLNGTGDNPTLASVSSKGGDLQIHTQTLMPMYPPYYPPSMYVIGQYAYFFDGDDSLIGIFRYHLTTKTFEIIYHAPKRGEFFFASDLIILENRGDNDLLTSLSIFDPGTNRWTELFV